MASLQSVLNEGRRGGLMLCMLENPGEFRCAKFQNIYAADIIYAYTRNFLQHVCIYGHYNFAKA